jgi:SAM-dependent methyltransferase
MSMKVLPRITPGSFDYGRGPSALRKHVQETVRAAFLEEHARIHTPAVLRRKVARLYRYQGFATGIAVRRALANERWMELLADALPAHGRVLDLGCGLGLASHWLAELHPRLEVVGVDRDAEHIRVARRSAAGSPRVTFVCGPVEETRGPADGALLRAAAARDLEETLRRLFASLGPGAPLLLPDLQEEQRGAVDAAGFLRTGDAPVYVRGGGASA